MKSLLGAFYHVEYCHEREGSVIFKDVDFGLNTRRLQRLATTYSVALKSIHTITVYIQWRYRYYTLSVFLTVDSSLHTLGPLVLLPH
jgi:hypothetical protein